MNLTIFQLVLLLATAFFVYQMYKRLNDISKDDTVGPPGSKPEPKALPPKRGIAPKGMEELEAMADEAMERGNHREAMLALNEARRQEPENPRLLDKSAFVRKELGQLDEAREFFEQSLEIDGANVTALGGLGSLYRQAGESEKAAECYEKALAVDPELEPAREELARLREE